MVSYKMRKTMLHRALLSKPFYRAFLLLLPLIASGVTAQAQSPYCNPDYSSGCSFGDRIDSMDLNNLTRANTGCTGAYEHYTADTINLYRQLSYTITLRSGDTYNQGFGAWIDYDNDTGFGDAGEFLGTNMASQASEPTTISFTVPASADTSGYIRLRLRANYNSEPASGDSCSTLTYGEAEDYVVDIGPAPSCIPPSGLALDSIMSDSALISWTGNNGGGNPFDLTFGPTGFSLGNGMDTITTMNDSAWIDSLTPGTTYDVYVREHCSATDSSFWTGPFTFTTQCGLYTAPYRESYDMSSIPMCWSEDLVSGSGWVFGQSGDPDFAASSASEHTGNGGYFAWMDLSGGADTSRLVSPKVDVSPLNNPELRFFFYSHNTNEDGTNELKVEAYNGAGWDMIDTIQANKGEWIRKRYLLNAYTFNDTVQIRLTGMENANISAEYNDLLLDDFKILEAPLRDAAGLDILQPNVSVCELPSTNVRVRVKNKGANTQDTIPVGYTVNGGSTTMDTLFASLASGMDTIFEFPSTNQFSADGTYTIEAFTVLSGDTLQANDSTTNSIENGSGTLTPSFSQQVGVQSGDYTYEKGLFVCGSQHDTYECARILTLTIDSLRHEDALDELTIELISPEGTSLVLWDQLGGASDQVMDNLIFTDTASTNITAASGPPYTGEYHSQEAAGFAKFQGETVNGEWTLRIYNDDATDTAAFFGWNMRMLSPNKPQPDLGADTTICQRENLLLDPGDDPDWGYVWEDNSTDSTQEVAGSFLDTNNTYTYHVTVTDERPLNQCSNSDTINVTVENCTDLGKKVGNAALDLKIHPNPASKTIVIEKQGAKGQSLYYELRDLQGRTLQAKRGSASRMEMEVSRFSKGVYLLKVAEKKGQKPLFQRKVLIE
ncbi:MAG: GEVED domain-containing protein [Flavobacteriales bacterium]